jgi:hypothetical protein
MTCDGIGLVLEIALINGPPPDNYINDANKGMAYFLYHSLLRFKNIPTNHFIETLKLNNCNIPLVIKFNVCH